MALAVGCVYMSLQASLCVLWAEETLSCVDLIPERLPQRSTERMLYLRVSVYALFVHESVYEYSTCTHV